MKTKLFTLANAEQYNSAKNDVIGTISNHIEKLFKCSIAVEMLSLDGGAVKLKFTYPFENTQMITQCIIIPADLAIGLMNDSDETKN